MGGIVSLPTFQAGLTTGYSDHLDLGSGEARPGGVENILEYNGAFLNVRTWFDTFLIQSIDGLADIDLRDAREVNPGRHGETHFNAYYGGRTITLTGKIRAHTLEKLRDMQQGLKQIFGDISRERPLFFRTGDPGRDVMIFCKKSAPILMAETQQGFGFTRDFQVTLRASSPFFVSYNEKRLLTSLGFQENFVTPATVAWINELDNPSFEAAMTGWAATAGSGAVTGPTQTAGDGGAQGGSGMVAEATTTGTSGAAGQVLIIYHHTTKAPIAGKTTIGMRGRVKAQAVSANALTLAVRVRCYDAADAYLGSVTIAAQNTPVTGTWYALVGVLPVSSLIANTAKVDYEFALYLPATAGNYTLRADGALMILSSSAIIAADVPTYFDGETTTVMAGARWTGTRHLSTSELLSTTGLEGKYTFEDGSAGSGSISVKSGLLVPHTTNPKVFHRSDAVKLANTRSTLKYTFDGTTSATGARTGLTARRRASSGHQYLLLQINQAAAANAMFMQFFKGTGGGAFTVLGSNSPTFAVSPSTSYWLRFIVNGNVLTGEHWTTDPALGGAPTTTFSHTLTGQDIIDWGASVLGENGIRLANPGSIGWRYDDHVVEAIGDNTQVAFTATNEGNASANPKLRLYGPLSSTATGGPAAKFSIVHEDDLGESVTQEMTLNAKSGSTLAVPTGNYIEIDSEKRTIKEHLADGDFVGTAFSQLDVASDWLELFPGDNPIEFRTFGPGTPQLQANYRDTFL
jgi:hypothetical protein